MSEQKNISPLLDGFTLGVSINEHHGVVCRPAIKENTNKKYIVKTISVPASQVQFDAMLLSGAYKDPGDAMEYFREKGESILKEAELLKKLSKIEGFLPYEGWQMEPITRRRLGYEIYLVGSYKRSLDKYIRKHAMTHLGAVNLALDLCAALSVCRQSGYLYVDLKPSNIFVSEKKEYRIGDLGFLSLDSLRYASLPERYFSSYTPPELLDPMTSMNLTADTYAVGMILYQLYNDGHLPFNGFAPAESLPAPCHADYEMAEIILKAIDPDPVQRWADPKDMGKAIASYMQRNSVNDIPITPFVPLDVKPEDIVQVSSKKDSEEDAQLTSETDTMEKPTCTAGEPAAEAEEPPVEEESISSEESQEISQEESLEATKVIEKEISDPKDTAPSEVSQETEVEEIPEEPEDPEEPEVLEVQPPLEISDALMEEPVASETPVVSEDQGDTEMPHEPETPEAPEEEITDSEDASLPTEEPSVDEQQEEGDPAAEISEEVARILSKADDIIAHEIPEESLFPQEEEKPDPFAFAMEDSEYAYDDYPAEPLMEDDTVDTASKTKKKAKHFENPSRKNKFKKFLSGCLSLVILCSLAVGGFWYYQNVYLQTIDTINVTGTQEQITVLVDTSIEESKLTVHCFNGNEKRRTEVVQGGKVTFTGLNPSTSYTIEVDMAGFHKLVGHTTEIFTTEATTQILSFQAISGSENGSVNLEFAVEGEDPDFWNIRYSAEGEEELVETVTGHTATITGLTVGRLYTFTLDGGKNFDCGGETSIQYLASRLILAEDLAVNSSDGTDITVTWKAPGDVIVESWNVRFYDGFGTEEQVTVTENQVVFSGLDPASHYTVEVTAAGMTHPARIDISADPVNVSNFKVDESPKTEMKVSWSCNSSAPEGGWLLHYTVDGSGSQVVTCEKPNAKITPLIPGANYKFTLQAADERTVYNSTVLHQAADAKPLTEYNFKADQVSFNLLKTPEEPGWSYETITEDAFTSSFQVGDAASIVLNSPSAVYLPNTKAKLLFVFRDAYGNVLPELTSEVSYPWKSIWDAGDTKIGEIDIPKLPSVSGDYQMEVLVNGGSMVVLDLTITD